jgi:hypothetical protein
MASAPLPHIPSLTELIAREIRALRKGRGVQAADLDSRLGPYLRELVASPEGDDRAIRRQILTAELNACAEQLAPDLRTAISASLALSPEIRPMAHLGDRVHWLAAHLDRDYRTALRRIEAAEQLLAEHVAHELRRRRGQTSGTPVGWYLDELRTLLRLDTAVPESYENRRIVATHPNLSEVVAWLDVPSPAGGHPPGLTGEVTHGGRLVRQEHPAGGMYQFIVKLPTPLQPGDTHEYGLRLRVSEGEGMRPHYIFTPECRCNAFDLRVRFDPAQPPAWVRRVEGEPVRRFDAPLPAQDLVRLDAAGEVHMRFHSPTMYLGYGAQWQPLTAGPGMEPRLPTGLETHA